MAGPATEHAQWWASDRTERVNASDAAPGHGATRSVRVAHLVRGDHTLCGRNASAFVWVPMTPATRRCPSCAAVGADRFIHRDITSSAGITYRQFDYWCREGYLRPDNPDPGSGSQRAFTARELEVATAMGTLTAAGLHPRAACRVARSGHLAPGVHVVPSDAGSPTTDAGRGPLSAATPGGE